MNTEHTLVAYDKESWFCLIHNELEPREAKQ
jgi:hypothetical protein